MTIGDHPIFHLSINAQVTDRIGFNEALGGGVVVARPIYDTDSTPIGRIPDQGMYSHPGGWREYHSSLGDIVLIAASVDLGGTGHTGIDDDWQIERPDLMRLINEVPIDAITAKFEAFGHQLQISSNIVPLHLSFFGLEGAIRLGEGLDRLRQIHIYNKSSRAAISDVAPAVLRTMIEIAGSPAEVPSLVVRSAEDFNLAA